MEKTIKWSDGTQETVKIDDNYQMYLDDKPFVPFGMCLSDYYSGTNKLAFWEKELSYLESIGVRVVHIQMKPEGVGKEDAVYKPLFDLITKHKMFMFVLITSRYFTTTFTPPNYKIGSNYDVNTFATNCCKVINQYPNVIMISADNECDLSSGPNGTRTYKIEDVAKYIMYLSGIIRIYCPGIPVVTKVVTQIDDFGSNNPPFFLAHDTQGMFG